MTTPTAEQILNSSVILVKSNCKIYKGKLRELVRRGEYIIYRTFFNEDDYDYVEDLQLIKELNALFEVPKEQAVEMHSIFLNKVHPKWGCYEVDAVKIYKQTASGEDYFAYVFLSTDDSRSYIGSLDREAGGGLSYPVKKVREFLALYEIDLLEFAEDDYCEYEQELIEEIKRDDPDFFVEV